FTNRVGDDLLSRTNEARTAATKYLARCYAAGSTPEEMLSKLTSQADESQLRETNRLMNRCIIWTADAQVFYHVAAVAISLFVGEEEGNEDWLVGREADGGEDRGLLIRLQVMASKLGCEPGW